MNTLELEPWEMPPACLAPRRAHADLEVELWGETCPLRLVRLSPGRWVMFVRRDGRNLLVLNGKTLAPHIWRVKPTDFKLRRVAARLPLGYYAGWFALASLFVWNDAAEQVLVAIAQYHPRQTNESHSRWRATWLDSDLTNPLVFRLPPQNEDRLRLQREANAPNSYARFAWEWKQATSEQKTAVWQEQQRRLQEMQELMRWVLWCLPEVWQEADELNLFYTEHYVTSDWFSNWKTRPTSRPKLYPASSELVTKWGALLKERFIPLHHIALLELNPHIGFTAEKYPPAVRAPTMHETLEARLELREWLEQNAPDQLETLLPS